MNDTKKPTLTLDDLIIALTRIKAAHGGDLPIESDNSGITRVCYEPQDDYNPEWTARVWIG